MARIAKTAVIDTKGKEKAKAKAKAKAQAPSARGKPVQREPEKATGEQHPNTSYSPPSVKNALVSGWRGFLILMVFIVGAYLTHSMWGSKIADHLPSFPMLQAKDPRVAVVSERLTALEIKAAVLEKRDKALSRLQQLYENLSANPAKIQHRIGLLEESLKEVRKKLAIVARAEEAAKKKGGLQHIREQLVGLEKNQVDITSARKALVDFDQRLRTLEKRNLTRTKIGQTGTGQKAAILLAVSQLRYIAVRGLAYERELETFKALTGDSASLGKELLSLGAHAKTGVPTLTSLRQEFSKLAGTMVAKAQDQSAEDWVANLAAKVGTLVTIRRIEGGEVGSVENLVASAEAQLRMGDLTAAMVAVKSVKLASSESARVAAGWLKRAEARLLVERALTELNNYAISLLGGTNKE